MNVKLLTTLLIVVVMRACTVQSQTLKRVCYVSNWSQYRPGAGQFFPNQINGALCTHIIYAFATMSGNQLSPYEWDDDSTDWSVGLYEKFNNVKLSNPGLKGLLAVGGWNFGTNMMSAMLSTAANRHEFVTTTITYLRSRNFDGLDLDFEYPGARGSPAGDKQLYTLLIQELRAAFDAEGTQTGRAPLLLTAAVAAGKSNIDNAYEIDLISQSLDFINLMSYDLNGAWDVITGLNSPLYARADEIGASDSSGTDRSTLNMVVLLLK
jgi:chitinase